MGIAYLALADNEEALTCFLTCIQTQDKMYSKHTNLPLAITAYYLGEVYFALNKYKKSKEKYYKSLTIR